MKLLMVLAITSLMFGTACSSLHSKVAKNIKIGDKAESVKDLLGEPASFERNKDGSQAWKYYSRGSECGFLIEKGIVTDMACDASRYVSPGAAAAQGFGQGMQQNFSNQSQSRTTCTSSTYGAQTYTDCQ